MMALISGSAEEVLHRVQLVLREDVPGANCQIVDYGKRIGCGELDVHGKLHELQWIIRDLDDGDVKLDAKRMAQAIAAANSRVQTDC